MKTTNFSLVETTPDLSLPWTSSAIYLGQTQNFSIHLVFDGAPEGSFRLRCSNDAGLPNDSRQISSSGVSRWTDVRDSTQVIDEAGDHIWEIMNAGYSWVHVLWAPVAGSGILNSARVTLKGY